MNNNNNDVIALFIELKDMYNYLISELCSEKFRCYSYHRLCKNIDPLHFRKIIYRPPSTHNRYQEPVFEFDSKCCGHISIRYEHKFEDEILKHFNNLIKMYDWPEIVKNPSQTIHYYINLYFFSHKYYNINEIKDKINDIEKLIYCDIKPKCDRLTMLEEIKESTN